MRCQSGRDHRNEAVLAASGCDGTGVDGTIDVAGNVWTNCTRARAHTRLDKLSAGSSVAGEFARGGEALPPTHTSTPRPPCTCCCDRPLMRRIVTAATRSMQAARRHPCDGRHVELEQHGRRPGRSGGQPRQPDAAPATSPSPPTARRIAANFLRGAPGLVSQK